MDQYRETLRRDPDALLEWRLVCNSGGYGDGPDWEKVRAIEEEIATRSGIGLELGRTDIATQIWQFSDEQ